MNGAVSVAVTDDHPIVVRGLLQLLEGSAFQVQWHASTAADCLASCRQQPPAILILDLRIGNDLGSDVLTEVHQIAPHTKTIILTGYDDGQLLRLCLHRGARAIVLKDARDLDLARVLDQVLAGEIVIDARLKDLTERVPGAPYGNELLTEREHEILRLVARGMTSREIGASLFLSNNTVRSYVQNLLTKLNAHTRIEAVSEARHRRII
jgi:two-component system response regulator DesR